MHEDYALYAAIVEAGSLSAAGRALRLSPAMVSKRLSRLEARLGVQLIRRTTRRLVTTEAGRLFHERVVAILAAAREAEALVAGGAGPASGRLKVTAPTSFGRLHVAPQLKSFLDAHPLVRLELELSDGFTDFLSDRTDLAIRIAAPAASNGLDWTLLAPNRRLLCAAPAYLAERGAPESTDDLARHRIVAATSQLPWRLEGPGGPLTLPVESAIRTNSNEVVRELALAGVGIALRSTWDVGAELRTGALVPVLPAYQGASDVAIYAVHPRSALVPVPVRAFISHLRALFAPVPPWERG
ncbi:MAG TPA: LysR family transcriptional regulator [Azospirillaceae bacterium]|nr:LysR family transcriptional regulator [Azospirillaceae bacterium]